ncbi:MAG: porin [Pirellulales bacterium]
MTRRLKQLIYSAVAACALASGSARASDPPQPGPADSVPPASTIVAAGPPQALPGAAPAAQPITQRLPAVDAVQPAAHMQAAPAGGAGMDSLDERFNVLEKEWHEFQERQKPVGYLPPGKPTLQFGGQVQVDSVWFGQDPVGIASVGDLQDSSDFRRTRLVMQGKSFEVFYYAFGVDFSLAPQPSLLDCFLEQREVPIFQRMRAGHYFEPFSLERVTQNRANTFMERSLVDTFAPARNLGVMSYGTNEEETTCYQIGTFRTNSDNAGNDSFDSGQALTMRGTHLVYWDEPSDGRYYMHVGACYSYRDAYRDQVRFRNSPEIRIQQPQGTSNFSPIFVDTGNIPAHSFQLFDAEFAWINGPFSVQSEYACSTVDQITGENLFFDAFMVQLSYILTGESRPYDRTMGIHRTVVPYSPFFLVRSPGGPIMGKGAWELATRFSRIKLNDKNILGNNLYDFTFGVNWYLSAYARVKFNYIRAFLDDATVGRSATNIYGLRLDFEF